MKRKILLVKSLLALSILFVSCDNNNDDIKCPDAITGELTETETSFSGTWILKSVVTEDEIDLTDDDTDNPSTNIYAQFSECERDIVYNFDTTRNYSLKIGKTADNCDTKQEQTGTWQLSSNNNLIFVSNCSQQIIAINFNDENTQFSFEGTYKFLDVDNNIITTKTTYTYENAIW